MQFVRHLLQPQKPLCSCFQALNSVCPPLRVNWKQPGNILITEQAILNSILSLLQKRFIYQQSMLANIINFPGCAAQCVSSSDTQQDGSIPPKNHTECDWNENWDYKGHCSKGQLNRTPPRTLLYVKPEQFCGFALIPLSLVFVFNAKVNMKTCSFNWYHIRHFLANNIKIPHSY